MQSTTEPEVQQGAVTDLIQRIVGDKSSYFKVLINPNYNDHNLDKFRVETVNKGHVQITATNGVAAATGFYHFLKYVANCSVGWSGDQLNLPPMQQLLSFEVIEQTIYDKFRYYMNVCTPSYSTVWWDWARWQKEIDWMALKGINMPLAFNGQEIIFRRVFEKYNFTRAEVDDYFTGPPFLAWYSFVQRLNKFTKFRFFQEPNGEHSKVEWTLVRRVAQPTVCTAKTNIATNAKSGHVDSGARVRWTHSQKFRQTLSQIEHRHVGRLEQFRKGVQSHSIPAARRSNVRRIEHCVH